MTKEQELNLCKALGYLKALKDYNFPVEEEVIKTLEEMCGLNRRKDETNA